MDDGPSAAGDFDYPQIGTIGLGDVEDDGTGDIRPNTDIDRPSARPCGRGGQPLGSQVGCWGLADGGVNGCWGTRTTNIDGQAVPSTCDPYSLYVQLSRCGSLDGIILLCKARERDIVENTVSEEMAQAEQMLEQLSEETIREVESWDWSEEI